MVVWFYGFYGFSRFQVRFSWFQVGFHFSTFQVVFSRFQVSFESKSWLQVGFYSYRLIFHGFRWFFRLFMAPGLAFMIPSGFSLTKVGLNPS